MKRAEHRRESLIALRATHTAHRVVNEIRFPQLPTPAPAPPEPQEPSHWTSSSDPPFLIYGRKAPGRYTSALLIVFLTLLAIAIVLYTADYLRGI